MNKKEFEKKIKELNLEKIYYQTRKNEYSKEIVYEESNKHNLYGCYLDGDSYVIFFKDAERGLIKELGYYKTEEEAYDELFRIISLWANKNNK